MTLSILSINIAPYLGSVGQNGAALDLSHVATFVAAFFGGPIMGAMVGLLGGIYAGFYFGYVVGTLGLLSLPWKGPNWSGGGLSLQEDRLGHRSQKVMACFTSNSFVIHT